jgi:hypothetical protein
MSYAFKSIRLTLAAKGTDSLYSKPGSVRAIWFNLRPWRMNLIMLLLARGFLGKIIDLLEEPAAEVC